MVPALVLVVDDSPVVRLTLRHILEPLGYRVHEAEDGRAAMQSLESGAVVDCVLCDIDMPEVDGLEFLRALRARTDMPQPRVLMCTGETSFARIREALEAGADEYIMKPFDVEIVRLKLRQCGMAA